MSHAYVSNLMHCIFSTKDRAPFIQSDLETRLWPYLGGIARENQMRALAIGGTTDHIHSLLSLPSTLSIAKAMQLLKGGSSKWVHDSFPQCKNFGWQEGYGALVLVSPRWGGPSHTLTARRITTEREVFRKSFLIFSLSTVSNSIRVTFSKLGRVHSGFAETRYPAINCWPLSAVRSAD
jgi:putative transposase